VNANIGRATHALLRFVAGLLFMMHGGQKLLGWFAEADWQGAPPIGSLFWVAGVLELVGGALVMLGLGTRIVAFILSGEMAVAYFQFHYPQDFWPTTNGGISAVLYCFLWLYFSAAGAGAWSLDARRKR
jgi:putative oxidoreductase